MRRVIAVAVVAAIAAFGSGAARALNAAGVTIVMGTDGNTPRAPHVEMVDMVAAGMTLAQDHGVDEERSRFSQHTRCRYAGGRQVRRLHRARRQPNTRRIAAVYLRGVAVDRSKAP